MTKDKKGIRISNLTATEPQTGREVKPTGYNQYDVKWVLFFNDSDNVYINDLALRARRSPTHSSILYFKYIFTVGNGFIYTGQDDKERQLNAKEKAFADKVNLDNESLYDIYKKVARDYIFGANCYVEDVVAQSVHSLFHKDTTTVRVAKTKDSFYISSFWRDIKRGRDTKELPVIELPKYDGTGKQKNSIIRLTHYEPEFEFYGIPDYHGVLLWVDIEHLIPKFNLDRFKKGFMPDIYMALFGEPPEGNSREQYVKKVVDRYTGEENFHKILVELLESKEQMAQFHEFTNTLKEGEFLEMDKLANQRIISGHRWFSSLSGLAVPGRLGNYQQILEEYDLALNTVVIPSYRTPIIEMFNKIIKSAGFDFKVQIKNLTPLSVVSQLKVNSIIFKNEGRRMMGLPEDPKLEGQLIESGTNNSSGNNFSTST